MHQYNTNGSFSLFFAQPSGLWVWWMFSEVYMLGGSCPSPSGLASVDLRQSPGSQPQEAGENIMTKVSGVRSQ